MGGSLGTLARCRHLGILGICKLGVAFALAGAENLVPAEFLCRPSTLARISLHFTLLFFPSSCVSGSCTCCSWEEPRLQGLALSRSSTNPRHSAMHASPTAISLVALWET